LGDHFAPSYHGAIRPGDSKKQYFFKVLKPEIPIQPIERLHTFRIMPRCENFLKLEDAENSDFVSYVCKGHFLNTHGDPLRDNRFWVYPLAMRPFNLGKGDYRSTNVEEICSRFKTLGTTEF
jgi:hypothetical protein